MDNNFSCKIVFTGPHDDNDDNPGDDDDDETLWWWECCRNRDGYKYLAFSDLDERLLPGT